MPLDNPNTTEKYKLKDGSKIAVIGGGPSGTFFSYFLLDMAARIDLKLHVDIYDNGCRKCPHQNTHTRKGKLGSQNNENFYL